MEQSVNKAINDIMVAYPNPTLMRQDMRQILLDFYKNRSIEILVHIEEQGLTIPEAEIKIGGTD